jgi:hypothetical protein
MNSSRDIFVESKKTHERLLFTLEHEYLAQAEKLKSQIFFFKILSIVTMLISMVLPIITWSIVLKNVDNQAADNLTVFAFTGMTLASVLIIIFVTLLRRSKTVENQANKIDILVDQLRKFRIACLAEYSAGIDEYIKFFVGKNLILQSSSIEEKDEDELKEATGLLGELQKIIASGKPK